MKRFLALSLAVAVMGVLTANASAATVFFFENITNNNAGDAAIGEAQLRMSVEDVGGQALFKFYQVGNEAAVIARIYWDNADGLLSSIAAIQNISGVDFKVGASPGNLPGGNTIGFVADLKVSAKSPAPHNGVGPDDTLGVLFNLAAGKTVTDLISSLEDGNSRVGMHVIAFASGGSEGFVTVVPLPAQGWAGLGLMAVMGVVAYRRKRATAAA